MSPLAQLNVFKSVMSSKQSAFHLPCQAVFLLLYSDPGGPGDGCGQRK